jgi:hypothetical protein
MVGQGVTARVVPDVALEVSRELLPASVDRQ